MRASCGLLVFLVALSLGGCGDDGDGGSGGGGSGGGSGGAAPTPAERCQQLVGGATPDLIAQCESCFEQCGDACLVQETNPPSFSCP